MSIETNTNNMDTPAWEAPSELGKLKTELPKTLSEDLKEELQGISHNEFLSKYSDTDRLKFITQPNTSLAKL